MLIPNLKCERKATGKEMTDEVHNDVIAGAKPVQTKKENDTVESYNGF